MSYDDKIKKYGADKIFLLGLFALALFIALLIVSAKTKIILGEPVEIPGAGLSIRLPNGNGWKSDSGWTHDGEALVLSSYFQPSPRFNIAQVICSYHVATFRQSADQWLEQQAAGIPEEQVEYGTQQAGKFSLEWVYLKEIEHASSVLAATTELDFGRWLDIEIVQMDTQEQMTHEIFEKITSHLVIEANKLLAEGIELIKHLKTEGLNNYIPHVNEPCFYLVKDSARKDVGYLVDILLVSTSNNHAEVQATGFGYIKAPNRWEKAITFKCDAGMDRFVWESETDLRKTVSIRRGPIIIHPEQNIRTTARLSLADGNELSVHRLGPESAEFAVRIGEGAIPEAVIEVVYTGMIKADVSKVMVDIILSDGRVQPAIITVNKESDNQAQGGYSVTIEYIGSDEVSEVYLDSEMHIVRKVLRQAGILTLEPTSLEGLVHRFPERADYILQRVKSIRQGKL